jgi:hypothetical protein
MEAGIRANGRITKSQGTVRYGEELEIYLEKASTFGWTVDNMRAIGWITTCTAKECTSGRTGGSTKASTTWIRSTGTASTLGLMARSKMETDSFFSGMREDGMQDSSMARGSTSSQMASSGAGNGRAASALSGTMSDPHTATHHPNSLYTFLFFGQDN